MKCSIACDIKTTAACPPARRPESPAEVPRQPVRPPARPSRQQKYGRIPSARLPRQKEGAAARNTKALPLPDMQEISGGVPYFCAGLFPRLRCCFWRWNWARRGLLIGSARRLTCPKRANNFHFCLSIGTWQSLSSGTGMGMRDTTSPRP